MKESDLFLPVKKYLEHNGYMVRAEVKNCDITATKDDELIIVELKLTANLQLLIQAADRQRITDSVYVAIVKPKKRRTKRWKGMKHLLRRLELGLIFIDLQNSIEPIEIVFHPVPFQRRKLSSRKRAVINEVENRSKNLNTGGVNKKKIITAYKENAIQIACYLNNLGASTPKHLRSLGTGKKTLSILSNNFYGWFQRIDRGIYEISAKGQKEIMKFTELNKKYENQLLKAGETKNAE